MAADPGLTFEELYDALFEPFRDAWEAGTPDVVGAVPPIEWPDEPRAGTPLSDGSAPWARVSVRHTDRWQASMGGPSVERKYASEGILTVSIFIPAGKRGLAVLARLGRVALDAFEGPRLASGLRVKDAVFKEVGVDGNWLQGNVKVGFYYENHR